MRAMWSEWKGGGRAATSSGADRCSAFMKLHREMLAFCRKLSSYRASCSPRPGAWSGMASLGGGNLSMSAATCTRECMSLGPKK